MINISVNNVYRKAEAISNEIRSKIVDGSYLPGERLPSRNIMMKEYDVSKVTIQNALENLNKEGFVITKNRCGSFVAEQAPHLTHFALLFCQMKEAAEKNHFCRALAKAVQGFNKTFKIDLHYGFEGADGAQQYWELTEAVKKRRLAGLLFASPPNIYKNTPILDVPDIPKSAFMSSKSSFNIPTVSVDTDGFLQKACKFIKEHGCQRVAVISSTLQAPSIIPKIQIKFKSAGINVYPDWLLGADTRTPSCTKTLARLLMSGSIDSRPDCLFVTDDNILLPISEALKELAITPPQDIQLIAHCNYPWPTPSVVPAVRLGYSMTECIQAMMEQIHDQQNLRIPQKHIDIPAYFEEELKEVLSFK